MLILIFLKFYIFKIFKIWLSILLFIPYIIEQANILDGFYFEGKYDSYFIFLIELIKKYHIKILVPVFIFWLLHIRLIYKLHTNDNQGYDVDLSEKYSNISNHIQTIAPDKMSKVASALKSADKHFSIAKDLKLIINTNFSAHKIIYDIVDIMYKNKDKRLVISQQSSEIKLRYDINFRELQEYNKLIGCNSSIDKNLHEIRKLVEDINDNLNSLFGYIQ